MKLLLLNLVFTFSIAASLVPTAHAAGPNLITNPDLETTNTAATMPTGWTNNRWGTNKATLTYKTGGYLSNRSTYITMSNYSNGDAKWIFDSVSVAANKQYTFSDYYQSNVKTRLVAMSTDASNKVSYFDVTTNVPASATAWKQATYSFKTLATTKKITILHLIDRNGWLQTDAHSLVDPTGTGTPPVTPCQYNAAIAASDPACVPPVTPCQYNASIPATSPNCVPPVTPCQYNPAIPATSPSCVPPTPCQYNASIPATSPNCVPPCQYNPVILSNDPACVPPAPCQYNPAIPATSPSCVPPVTPNNSVPNPSMETVSPADTTLPTGWNKSSWGTNTPKYEYLNEGQSGSRSTKVTITNYQSGDAKWAFTPQALTRGADYKFSAWYKTNTTPHVVAQYIHDDGSETYYGLPDPQTSGTGWFQYNDTFNVPATAKAVSVFFYINTNGYVQTDNYSVTPYQVPGFTNGMVTLTFDDGFEQNVTTALPVLAQYNFKTTYCVATTYVQGQPTQEAKVKQIANAGHEICSHSVTHPDLTSLTSAQLTTELTQSKNYLKTLTGQQITNFASPFGGYNAAVNTEIAKYYASHRTTDEGYNTKDNLSVYRLRVQNMTATTTLAQVQAWVNKAKADKTWLILLYHVVEPTKANVTEFDTWKPDFDAQMQFIAGSGLPVVRWDQALATAKAQL